MFASPRPISDMNLTSPIVSNNPTFDFTHSNPASPLRKDERMDLHPRFNSYDLHGDLICRLDYTSEGTNEGDGDSFNVSRQRNKANQRNDSFAQRIPVIKQISLSYGGDFCQNSNDLSLQLPPPKVKGKRRDLTDDEKEIFSKEGTLHVFNVMNRYRVCSLWYGGPGNSYSSECL